MSCSGIAASLGFEWLRRTEALAPALKDWANGGATEIVVEIPPLGTKDCILGIACRNAHSEESSQRIVRLCIESIGFA